MQIPILIFLAIVIIIFNIYTYLFEKKIKKLESDIMNLFKRRTSQITWIYQTTKDDLVKANEIFAEFFELKRKEFWQDSFNIPLKEKLLTYKKIHHEINFIFSTCEKHQKIFINPIYLYFKDSVVERSWEIWEKIGLYNNINKTFQKYRKISKLTIVWLFY